MMQFYVIHPDPETNAMLLPDYALKRVNLREGWQILSDIGHAHDVKWEGQYKEYNRYHPNCWRWWKSRECFVKFNTYYFYCLLEYQNRFNKPTVWHDYFFSTSFHELMIALQYSIRILNEHQHTAEYIIRRKSKHLTEEEVLRLRAIVEGKR
jgi:hypothetical protein